MVSQTLTRENKIAQKPSCMTYIGDLVQVNRTVCMNSLQLSPQKPTWTYRQDYNTQTNITFTSMYSKSCKKNTHNQKQAHLVILRSFYLCIYVYVCTMWSVHNLYVCRLLCAKTSQNWWNEFVLMNASVKKLHLANNLLHWVLTQKHQKLLQASLTLTIYESPGGPTKLSDVSQ